MWLLVPLLENLSRIFYMTGNRFSVRSVNRLGIVAMMERLWLEISNQDSKQKTTWVPRKPLSEVKPPQQTQQQPLQPKVRADGRDSLMKPIFSCPYSW